MQHRLKKDKRHEKKLEKAAIRAYKEKKTDLIHQIYTTVPHHFPQLFDWMREVDDPRKKASSLELAVHLTACLAMFIFKAGSRNEYNQKRAIKFRRDKQQGLTVRPELVEGSFMVRQAHHERLNFKLSRLKWVAIKIEHRYFVHITDLPLNKKNILIALIKNPEPVCHINPIIPSC